MIPLKIDLNNNAVLARLYENNTTENSVFFGCTERAIQKAKKHSKYLEYAQTRNEQSTERLNYAVNRAVDCLISLLNSDNEIIRLNTCKAIIGAYTGLKPYTAINEPFVNVDKVIVAIAKTANNESE